MVILVLLPFTSLFVLHFFEPLICFFIFSCCSWNFEIQILTALLRRTFVNSLRDSHIKSISNFVLCLDSVFIVPMCFFSYLVSLNDIILLNKVSPHYVVIVCVVWLQLMVFILFFFVRWFKEFYESFLISSWHQHHFNPNFL